MRSADTEFIGGPLDGRVLPIYLSPFNAVPKVYKVPVPAHGEEPARTLVYLRAKRYSAKGRPRWVYEYAPEQSGQPQPPDGSDQPDGPKLPDGPELPDRPE
ncbi:hypothetical protein ACFZB9_02025 [Kitasatospora sp. NPDC008050]|uniref:hypothetical protein n=1 Tax=Kitasatospora sp. NPDC008050 TaxID=3364021 RepID=UPI0036F030C3